MVTYCIDRNKIEHESSAALQGCTDTKSGKGHLMHIKNSLRAVVIPIGPSIAYVPLTKGLYSLIDADDADWVGQYNWYAHRYGSGHYAQRQVRKLDKQIVVALHNAILSPDDGLLSDHSNCNGLDNRRANLRPATEIENRWNKGAYRNNKSGLKGVSPAGRKWQAQATLRGKTTRLGPFSTPEEAHKAYCAAVKELHGEFARTA